MLLTRLYFALMCMVAAVAMPLLASAQTIYSLDFESDAMNAKSGAGWDSTEWADCEGQVIQPMGDTKVFEMRLPAAIADAGAMGECVRLEVGPVNVSGYMNLQFSAQWKSGTPGLFSATDSLTFDFKWTGPNPGGVNTWIDDTTLNNGVTYTTETTGSSIPDDAANVMLWVWFNTNTNSSSVFIDNIRITGDIPMTYQTPAMTKWGMAVFAALAGLVVIYYLRKRTREV